VGYVVLFAAVVVAHMAQNPTLDIGDIVKLIEENEFADG
jgi:hypothetical protein